MAKKPTTMFQSVQGVLRIVAGGFSVAFFHEAWTMSEHGEYLAALTMVAVAMFLGLIAVSGWSGFSEHPRLTKPLKWFLRFVIVGWGAYSAFIIWRNKGSKPWSNVTPQDLITASSYLSILTMISWRWLAVVGGIVLAFLLGRFSRRATSERKTDTYADAYTDEWLREVLRSDRTSIDSLVKVFLVDWKPEFSTHVLRPYIDFWLAISNISVCAVRFEESIGGYITFQKDGAVKRSEFKENPVLAPDQELDVLPRKPGLLIIRQWLDRTEADEITTSGSKSKFWLHELQVYFSGEGINRTQLSTSQVLEKDRRWIADPGLYYAHADVQPTETSKAESPPTPITSRDLPTDLIKQIEEEYDLKKLEPNFIDRGCEYVEAHNDEQGVIIRGANPDGETFHALVRMFGNEHPRNNVKSLKRVSFRLNFICFDRATRNKSQSVNTDRGAWLNEAQTEIEFAAHCPSKRAVVVTVEGSDNQVSVIRRDSDSYKGIHPLREKLAGSIYTVFLTLLDESRNNKSFQYILEIIREPGFELRLNESAIWKSRHLRAFMDEGFEFIKKLHAIWEDAHQQVPLPPPTPVRELFPNYAIPRPEKEESPPVVDFFEAVRQRDAIQRAREETLIETLEDWQTRVAAFLELWFTKEQSDKFVNCVPTFEDGLNCKPRGSRLSRAFARRDTKAPVEPEHWGLADAVSRRYDVLMELM